MEEENFKKCVTKVEQSETFKKVCRIVFNPIKVEENSLYVVSFRINSFKRKLEAYFGGLIFDYENHMKTDTIFKSKTVFKDFMNDHVRKYIPNYIVKVLNGERQDQNIFVIIDDVEDIFPLLEAEYLYIRVVFYEEENNGEDDVLYWMDDMKLHQIVNNAKIWCI